MTNDESEKKIGELAEAAARLLLGLGSVGLVLRGSVVERWMPCGKKGCACLGDPPRLHGPYLQWTTKVGGKTKTVRLTKGVAAQYRAWIQNGRNLDAVIRELERLGEAAAEVIRGKSTS